MASVRSEAQLDVPADRAWSLLRDIGCAERCFPGVLVACRLEGAGRVVTFASGAVVRERIIDVDEGARRVAYAVQDRFEHHHASMQVVPDGEGRCRFVWVTDVLPDAAAPRVRALVEQGTAAFRWAAEAGAGGVDA